MQLVILIIVNIALATVFYLVISLKLEKNASEYREKKFRREMDEVIREFNNTAERNISLLEHKINVMKKLLRESGQLSSLDITVGENRGLEQEESSHDDPPAEADHATDTGKKETEHRSFASLVTDGIDSLKKMVKDVSSSNESQKTEDGVPEADNTGMPPAPGIMKADKGSSLDITLEKDFSSLFASRGENDINNKQVEADEAGTTAVDTSGLKEMFNETGDKYGLVADLYKKGYPLDILARSSGIPLGELKLILNLSTSM